MLFDSLNDHVDCLTCFFYVVADSSKFGAFTVFIQTKQQRKQQYKQ